MFILWKMLIKLAEERALIDTAHQKYSSKLYIQKFAYQLHTFHAWNEKKKIRNNRKKIYSGHRNCGATLWMWYNDCELTTDNIKLPCSNVATSFLSHSHSPPPLFRTKTADASLLFDIFWDNQQQQTSSVRIDCISELAIRLQKTEAFCGKFMKKLRTENSSSNSVFPFCLSADLKKYIKKAKSKAFLVAKKQKFTYNQRFFF